MLRQLVQQNPAILQSLLAQLAQSNPALLQAIQQNPQEFMSLLMEGGAPGAPGAGAPPGSISVTPEEMAAIDRLAALGFDKTVAAQAYFACDKNEEIAANYLFDHGAELEEDEGEGEGF
eukprot:TRINITY_DN3134_c0_g1_i1.p1 TRINITY_DN3134_c0_g1~~TRINITY_DN3134_c0_g1_i1.p1  ORF type:complete len:119 (-),score=45.31 TRINITY_DN3134_c0_g1_i1:61-417(-)